MFTDYRVEHTVFEHALAASTPRKNARHFFKIGTILPRQMSCVRQLCCAMIVFNLRILKHVRCTLQESNVTCLPYVASGAPLCVCGAQSFKLYNTSRTTGFICPRGQSRFTVISNTDEEGIKKTLYC